MPEIKPGDVFFDKLPDGRYERCILQPTTGETPDRARAARGGTGVFYRSVDTSVERIDDDDEMIRDIEYGCVFIRRESPVEGTD